MTAFDDVFDFMMQTVGVSSQQSAPTDIENSGFDLDRTWSHTGQTEWHETLVDWTDWFTFKRLALTPDQIAEFNLPPQPLKSSDVRTAKFTGSGTVEVEALPVEALLHIVEQSILDLIDPTALRIAEEAEQSERNIARRIAATPVQKLVEAAA